MKAVREDLDAIRKRCTRSIPVQELYGRLLQLGMEYAPQLRGVQALWGGEGECVGQVVLQPLPIEGSPEAALIVHPALLDACFQTLLLSAFFDGPQEAGPYAVLGLRSLTIYEQLPSKMWCWCRWDAERRRDPIATGDLRMLDDTGRVLAQVGGLRIMRTSRSIQWGGSATDRIGAAIETDDTGAVDSGCFYGVAWHKMPQVGTTHLSLEPNGHWLIVGEASEPVTDLVQTLEGMDQCCTLVGSEPASLRGAVERFARATSRQGVAFFAGVCVREFLELKPEEVMDDLTGSCEGLRQLLLVLAQARVSGLVHGLSVLTCGSHAVVDGDTVEPLQSGLSAFARVAAWEHPQLEIRLIDLPQTTPEIVAHAVLRALTVKRREWQIAVRGEDLYNARLVRRSQTVPIDDQTMIRSGASYLITGGQGGLGLQVARWLASRGAGFVVLMSRRQPTAATLAMIDELRSHGCEVLVARGDVTSAADVRRALLLDDGHRPAVSGVFHAAMVMGNELLTHETSDAFRTVVSPKVVGAYHLHRAAAELGLDFVAHFSSATSVLGLRGQGSYSAANGVLDGLACSPSMNGTRTLAINWGAWADVGVAAEMKRRGEGLIWKWGIGDLTPEEGLRALASLMCAPNGQTVVMRCDWRRLAAATPRGDTFFEELVAPTVDEAPGVSSGACDSEILVRLRETSPGARLRLIEDYLQEVLTKLVGLPAGELLSRKRPLMEQGVDSLMAIDLREQLNRSFGQDFELTLAFDYPTIDALSRRLEMELMAAVDIEHAPPTPGEQPGPTPTKGLDPPPEPAPSHTAGLDRARVRVLRMVERLTDEEAEEMLRRLPGSV